MTTTPTQPFGTRSPNQEPVDPSPAVSPAATNAPEVYTGPGPTQDERNMAVLCHLLGIFSSFLGPLVIWLLKKDSSKFVDDQGKEALNFQITLLIGYAASFVLAFMVIGFLIGPAVWIAGLLLSIVATTKASRGVAYRYPINVRLIQ